MSQSDKERWRRHIATKFERKIKIKSDMKTCDAKMMVLKWNQRSTSSKNCNIKIWHGLRPQRLAEKKNRGQRMTWQKHVIIEQKSKLWLQMIPSGDDIHVRRHDKDGNTCDQKIMRSNVRASTWNHTATSDMRIGISRQDIKSRWDIKVWHQN